MSGAVVEQEDDAALVARCLEDDPRAWELLVRRFGPLVFTVTRRAGLSAEDSADVYQTVWLAALEGIGRLRDPERVGAWLARMAHLQSARMLRDRDISRRALGRLAPVEADDEAPESEIEALEDRRRVSDALGRVGERCRTLLRLLYFEGGTAAYADVAARLRVPVGSIGPTRARCLEQLEREIERS